MTTAAPTASPRLATILKYTDRRSKALYIADKYAALLTGSVLDVGCDEAPLRKLVHQPTKYKGVDIHPGADAVLDLDRENLPFTDRSFDTVLCTDVLEHLERCHEVFDELCRVARTHIIVSLPNPLRNLLTSLAEGSAGRIKYYGLPADRPPDRHRWFFGAEEAAEFLRVRGARNGFDILQLDFEEGGCPSWKSRDGTDLLASPNIRLGTLWCVLARREA
jgi:SAM-dependent methyltransferase